MEEKGINSYGFKVKGDEAPKSYGVEVIIMSSVDLVTEEMKKKRKRPRKYGQDGKVAVALSLMPILASIPLAGYFSSWKNSASHNC